MTHPHTPGAAGRFAIFGRLGETGRLVLAAAVVLAVVWSSREVIPMGDGLGGDGQHYARWVKNFDHMPLSTIDQYRILRILPSLIIHTLLKLAGFDPIENTDVIGAFTLLNLVCALLTVLVISRCGDLLGWQRKTRWLAFASVVLSHQVVKMSLYNPVLTDMTALSLGATLMYFYLARRWWAVAWVTLLGTFVWPLTAAVGAVLLIAPRESPEKPSPTRSRSGPALGFGAVAGLALQLAIGWVYGSGAVYGPARVAKPILALLPLSAALAALFLGFTLYHLFREAAPVSAKGLANRLWRVETGVALALLGIWWVVPGLLTPKPPDFGPSSYLGSLVYRSSTLPAIFLVAHAFYFGPVVLFAILRWRQVAAAASGLGPAIPLILGATCLMSLNSESRQLSLMIPFVTVAAMSAIDQYPWSNRDLVWTAGLALLMSKLWLILNTSQRLPILGNIGWEYKYWATQGPWMPYAWYGLQLVVLGILLAVVRARLASFPLPSGRTAGRASFSSEERSADALAPMQEQTRR